jgi:hypothetical protein
MLVIAAISFAIGLYVVGFLYCFDVGSAPVRSSDGWLGPLLRGDTEVRDIGKVWYADRPDASMYRTYRPLCWLWLQLDGLELGS